MKIGLVSAEYAERIRQKAQQLSDGSDVAKILFEIA